MSAGARPDLEEFRSHLAGLGRSPRTADTYIKGIQRLERSVGKPVHDVSAPDLIAYRSSDAPIATIQITMTAMRSYHLFGVERGYWPMDGIMAVATPRRTRTPSEWLSTKSTTRLLEAASSPREVRLVFLGLYAGCRISETAAMAPNHDMGDRLRFVGKGAKLREVPIHPELRARLDYIFSKPTRTQNLHRLVRCMRADTGINFRSHALRATFAHLLEEADVEHDVRAALLGHASTQTMGYSGISWRRKVEAIERLSFPTLPTVRIGEERHRVSD